MAENILQGGVQIVAPIAPQIVYLDFDGELTRYNGELLTIDNVEVQHSLLTDERIENILSLLNEKYASQNVKFVTSIPASGEYSTIYIGKTSAFDAYGTFAGLAETIDHNNANKSDNAFVNLDSSATDLEIVNTISHETDHLLGTLDHGGEGLNAYAAAYYVSSGVTSTGITLYYDSMYILSGGVANSTIITSGGDMYISSGGVANSTTVYSGDMYIYSGGVANRTTVYSSGRMYISSGGIANSTTVSYGYMYISSGGTANNTTVNCGGVMYVSSGGVANRTTVNSYGYMYISSGGTANSTTVNSSGRMYIFSGGTANNTTVNSYGSMCISSGGVANSTTVYLGDMYISSGGIANSTTVNPHGCMYISSGGVANSTTVSDGAIFIYSGGVANSTTVNSSGRMYISSGGVANNTTLSGESSYYFYFSAVMYISNGGTANSTIINTYGSMDITSGGTANSTTVNSGGVMYVSSGGTASILFNPWQRGTVSSAYGATVEYLDRDANIYIGNASSGVISKCDTCSDVIISSGVLAIVYSGGTANSTTVNGTLVISSGGVHTGQLQISSPGYVYVYADNGAMIDFTLTGRESQDGYLINDLSLISGAPTYTITIAADQALGEYKLAQGANDFNNTISIGDGSLKYGTLNVNNGYLRYNGKDYSLICNNGNLSLLIKTSDLTGPTAPIVSVSENGPTNTNVTVTAVFADDSVKNEYCLEDGVWRTYESGIVFTSNGAVSFRSTDNVGNVSEITTYNVSNIDKEFPTLSITGNVTDWTNQDVILSAVTADTASGVKSVEYSFDNVSWTNGASVTVTENKTVYFRVTDYAGNITADSVIVDKIVPAAPTIELQAITEDKQNVALTVTYTEDDITKQYSMDQINWQEYTKDFVPEEKTTYYFRAVDKAGNIGNMASIVIADYRVKTFSGGVLDQYGSRLDSVIMTEDAVNAMYVSSGGLAYGTQINENTKMHVLSGGSALQTYVMKSATLDVGSGTVFSGIIVSSGGKLEIASGGVVNDLTFMRYANTERNVGGPNKDEEVRGNKITPITNATVNSFTLVSRCQAEASDALLYNVVLQSAAQLKCFTGEETEGKMILSGAVVHSDAQLIMEKYTVASDVIVSKAATLKIQNGGRAINTVIDRDGKLEMLGCIQHTVMDGGSMYVGDTAYHNYDGTGGMPTSNVYEEDIHAVDTVLNSSWLHIYSGGTATSNMVNSNSWLHVYYGGTATSNTVNSSGYITVHCSGTLDTVEVHSGGYLRLNAGSVLKDNIFAGGKVTVSSAGTSATEDVVRAYGANIYFMVNERTTSDDAIITDLGMIMGASFYITVAHDQASGMYKLATGASDFTGSISIGTNGSNYGSLTVNGASINYDGVTCALIKENDQLMLSIKGTYSVNVSGDKDGVLFSDLSYGTHVVKYSQNNFANTLSVKVDGHALDTYGLPAGTYQWQVDDIAGNEIYAANSTASQKLISDADGDMDLFFAEADGTWTKGYAAEHHGILYGWDGTGERVSLKGKNHLSNIFAGSNDANILVMTDDANGDTLFLDDIYSVFGDQARIAQIKEIRAGAGDDVIDMTSQRFTYSGDGVKIYGGLGDDTIWANNGNNTLFGDAGNDRIVGGNGNDVIIGGSGNDSMHGGGGDDVFCFGENWGNDTIEQLSGGSVTLWFEQGSVSNWNVSTLTYSDGINSVKISGVDNVTLKFGDVDTAVAGAFLDAASEKIFENKNSGMIA